MGLLQYLEPIDWHSRALYYLDEIDVCHEKEAAHRVYSDRMRRALIEITNLPKPGAAAGLARRALGMEE